MIETSARVQVNDLDVTVTTPEGSTVYTICEMPEDFFQWQLDSRIAMFENISRGLATPNFHAHLPVVATINREIAFPIHTATKATGLLPRRDDLAEYNEALSACLTEIDGKPWSATQEQRITAARRLYATPQHVDRRTLGLVEIFQGQTFRNLASTPLMTLQYSGPGPEYRSYQLNGVIEMVAAGDPRYEFLYLMRQLFEHNSFHVQQPAYPSGYVFWISEVYEKSPRRSAGRRIR